MKKIELPSCPFCHPDLRQVLSLDPDLILKRLREHNLPDYDLVAEVHGDRVVAPELDLCQHAVHQIILGRVTTAKTTADCRPRCFGSWIHPRLREYRDFDYRMVLLGRLHGQLPPGASASDEYHGFHLTYEEEIRDGNAAPHLEYLRLDVSAHYAADPMAFLVAYIDFVEASHMPLPR